MKRSQRDSARDPLPRLPGARLRQSYDRTNQSSSGNFEGTSPESSPATPRVNRKGPLHQCRPGPVARAARRIRSCAFRTWRQSSAARRASGIGHDPSVGDDGPARLRARGLTNRALSAREAYEWGLVIRVVPDAELASAAPTLARELAQGPTRAFVGTKGLFHQSTWESLETHMELEAQSIAASGRTEDFRADVTAFANKQPRRRSAGVEPGERHTRRA
jgi:Enoyl-CoA hydratase/isomerase